jgi:hypothetical protein
MVQYAGHGYISAWGTDENLNRPFWHSPDLQLLDNSAMLPVIVNLTCLDGYFAYPTELSMAELALRLPGGGMAAGISPSGLGLPQLQNGFRRALMDTLFLKNVREIGQALLQAKREYYTVWRDEPGFGVLIDAMMLYGDPAMRLPEGVGGNRLYRPDLGNTVRGAGQPGRVVRHRIWLTNAGNATDSYHMTVSSGWNAQTEETVGPVAPGERTYVYVEVTIPADAPDGTQDRATLTVTSANDARKTDRTWLLTDVGVLHQQYLPIVSNHAP